MSEKGKGNDIISHIFVCSIKSDAKLCRYNYEAVTTGSSLCFISVKILLQPKSWGGIQNLSHT